MRSRRTIAAVPADRWAAPSPCPEWNARDLVTHVVTTQGMILGQRVLGFLGRG